MSIKQKLQQFNIGLHPPMSMKYEVFMDLLVFIGGLWDFSTIATPLNAIVKKDVVFKWGQEQENAFQTLKDKLTKAPILALPNFAKTFEIECDASNIGIGAVLLKKDTP